MEAIKKRDERTVTHEKMFELNTQNGTGSCFIATIKEESFEKSLDKSIGEINNQGRGVHVQLEKVNPEDGSNIADYDFFDWFDERLSRNDCKDFAEIFAWLAEAKTGQGQPLIL
jgi:hypothetical protein